MLKKSISATKKSTPALLEYLTTHKEKIFPLIFVFSLLLRIALFALNPDNAFIDSDEPWEKIIMGINWANPTRPFPLPASYGPLHTSIIASFQFIFNTTSTTVFLSRAWSLIFSSVLLICFYATCKTILKKSQALWSAFFLAICPIDILAATTSLAESTAYAFLFASFYLFAKLVASPKQPQTVRVILLSLCISAACALRFECWFFIPLFALYATLKKQLPSQLILLCVLLAIYPVFWMWHCWSTTGDALYFTHISSLLSSYFLTNKSAGTLLSAFSLNLSLGMSAPIAVFCLTGLMWQSFNKKNYNFYCFFTLSFIILLIYKTLNHTHDTTQIRYIYPLILMLAVYAGPGFETMLYFLVPQRHILKTSIAAAAICTLITAAYLNEYRYRSELNRINDIKTICVKMSELTSKKPNTNILIENGVFTPFIRLQTKIATNRQKHYTSFPPQLKTSPKKLNQYLADCTYIVVKKTSYLQRQLDLIPDLQHRFEITHIKGSWRIYTKLTVDEKAALLR